MGEVSSLSLEGIRRLAEAEVLAVGVLEEGVLADASPKLVAMFGASPIGRPFAELVAFEDRARVLAALAGGDGPRTVGFAAERADGSRFEAEITGVPLRQGGSALAFVAVDVTERRRTEKQLSYMAYLDPLTGLPNRALFLDRLRDAIAAAARDRRVFAVLMCDLDGFKAVNDTWGHEAGDTVLEAVSRRLEGALRENDTVARLGGDEFAVLLPKVARREDVAMVAERLVAALTEPVDIGRARCKVGISIGIATFPLDGGDMDRLVARADVAMYDSKRAGKNRFSYAAGTDEAPHAVPILRWSDAHDVGNVMIDAQHRHLVELVNQLGEDLKHGRDRDTVLAAMRAVVAFTTKHFAAEERLMAQNPGWKDEGRHAQEHKKLLSEITSLTLDIDTSSLTMTMRFLQEWLLRHIEGSDRPLAGWVRERSRS